MRRFNAKNALGIKRWMDGIALYIKGLRFYTYITCPNP